MGEENTSTSQAPSTHLNWLDFTVIGVYFVFVLLLGLFVSCGFFYINSYISYKY